MRYFFLLTATLGFFLAACTNSSESKVKDGHEGHMMPASGANYADSVNNGSITEDTMKGSPKRVAMQTVGGTHVHIEYSSPGVKGRVIWGGLVPYDKVWATGAHKATTVQFFKAVEIDGKTIDAGKYALFTIPGKEKWTVIFNTRYDQHLADDYNEAEDVLRTSITPQAHELTQRLTYTVEKSGDRSGSINIYWDKIHIAVPFSIK